MAVDTSKLISVADAAYLLRVSDTTVRNWVQQGRLRAYKVGGRVTRVDPADLDALVQPTLPEDEVPQ